MALRSGTISSCKTAAAKGLSTRNCKFLGLYDPHRSYTRSTKPDVPTGTGRCTETAPVRG